MQIREGAYYRTRAGFVHGPLERSAIISCGWRAQGWSWTVSGFHVAGAESEADLISEVYVSDTPPADASAPEVKTLRDEFAGYAVIGLLAAGDCHAFNRKEMAAEAYRQADAMMEARKK